MLLEGGFLVSSQAQLQNVSESHRDTFVIIVQEMQLHLISTNQDFLEFLFFADALGPSSNTGNRAMPRLARQKALHRGLALLH